MRAHIVLAAFIIGTVGATAQAKISKVNCVINKSTLEAPGQLPNGTPVTMDLSGAVKEGDGPSASLGQVGGTPMSIEIYLSDKATSEFSLQINEGAEANSGSVLASSILNPSGASKILYRAVGSNEFVIVACYPAK